MRRSLNVFLLGACLALGLISQTYAADKSIADATADPAKVAKKVWFGPAPSQIKKLHDIGMPKRIGLISFYVFDTGAHEYSTMADVVGPTIFKQWGGSELNANIHARFFADLGVPVIKQRFAEKGMEVLTPVEFLRSEKELNTYFSLELTKSGLQKASESTLKWLDRNPHATGAADGYRMIPLHSSFLGKDVMTQLDGFRKAFDLDALMVVTTHTSSNKVGQRLASVTMQLVGPNPEPRPDNEKYLKWWWPMIMYPSANFGKGFKGAPFHTFETKRNPATLSYAGYDVIIDAMSTRTLAELQKHFDKGAK